MFHHTDPNLNRNAAYVYICVQKTKLKALIMVSGRVRLVNLMIYVYNIGFCSVPKGQDSIPTIPQGLYIVPNGH